MTDKTVAMIYNPFSGDKSLPSYLDKIFEVFHLGGYDVRPRRLMSSSDAAAFISSLNEKDCDALCVCGGDGTINLAVNAMFESGKNFPLCLIPSGTANDFTRFLGISKHYDEAARCLTQGSITETDIGCVNGKYFINVCAGGAMSSVSQSVDLSLKNGIGKLAYYIKGLSELTNLTPLSFKINTDGTEVEDELYNFLVLNSAGTGGFRELSNEASVFDGIFEFIGIRACPLTDLAVLLVKTLANPKNYINDSNILYLRGRNFEITPLFDDEKHLTTDTDGEKGPDMPLSIKVLHRKLRVFV